MALNMDDLIGSMQHGFHAGDRGNDLNEIRDTLKVTLGTQQPLNQQAPMQPRRAQQYQQSQMQQAQQYARTSQWDPRSSQSHSSLDADVAMLSGSMDPSNSGTINTSAAFGGPGSYGSQGSSTSSFGFGSGWAPAPANTPQQTPVETSALARQLQAELERARENQNNHLISEVDERSEHDWPQTASAGISPTFAQRDAAAQHPNANAQDTASSPRRYINGFSPSPSAS
ncbi:hypothetical protein BCV70DRAFT_14817 [Testicularia cyperi]|uniref:Uncharacterized protein n=1 Tax=Testicularia cyperi TaxID=1882483 RepID=A0A317XYD8_9BASI|nr:hypothetical protein BCV70DRAFT_14817 [Testicularia cyperi]